MVVRVTVVVVVNEPDFLVITSEGFLYLRIQEASRWIVLTPHTWFSLPIPVLLGQLIMRLPSKH